MDNKELVENLINALQSLRDDVTDKEYFEEYLFDVLGSSYPLITKWDISYQIKIIKDKIIENRALLENSSTPADEGALHSYVDRMGAPMKALIPGIFNASNNTVFAFLSTLDDLHKCLEKELEEVQQESLKTREQLSRDLMALTSKVRAMEARANSLAPRTDKLDETISRIENAHSVAEQLPADIETLKEDRETIKGIIRDATTDKVLISEVKSGADEIDVKLKAILEEAEATISRCETAYSSATSVGLAAAFHERSDSLNSSMWKWVVGLVVALCAGALLGTSQLNKLADLAGKPEISEGLLLINIVLSILSVGGPIWFAWISTKQIGQRFKLAEDYAFKASISRAYEGYRREAAKIDKDLELSLLSSALTRLDEVPLRLVEEASHGSPWHELIASDSVKSALKTVPGFVDAVKDLAKSRLSFQRAARERVDTPVLVDIKEEQDSKSSSA